MQGLEQTIEDIKKMRIRGALDIAIAAAKAMHLVVKKDAKDTQELIKKLRSAGERLKSSRPSAVSLPNAVNYIFYIAEKNKELEIEKFREKISSEIQRFVEKQERALKKIAEIGSNLIQSGDVILTHCNSDTVNMILEKAWRDGKGIEVICTETRPRYQGIITVKELSSSGIPTTLIVDSAVHLIMRKLKVNKVLVGADTICANGDLINKIGTSQIALCAKELDIDFIVAAESIKFSPESVMGSVVEIEERDPSEVIKAEKLKDVRVLNPVFDITDARYISMIITEYGVIPPEAAYHLLKEKFGWELEL
ncbi:MAG: ribose 1,5-bisphosphate isomerase [Candidatus Altiarchaeales archaeon]|nr:MAG: ribose 1,5-bisphosphate isomerase [Candidatus Altiarchaeales archaeon]HDI73148.1 ribose 1,5-bisphosphate isomerase [Candidatus Altiarchaeales archaeon]